MATQIRQRTLQYKRATFLSGSGNLQQMLAAAFKRYNDVADREEILAEGGTSCRVVSNPKTRQGMQTGRLLQYTPGQRQSLLERDEANKDYTLSTVAPSVGKDNQRREFVESILYFAVKDNHVMILGSVSLNPRALEVHLNWLLEKSGQIKAGDDGLLLADQATKDAGEKIKKFPIKGIQLGSRLQFGIPEPEAKSKSTRLEPVGDAAQALTAYLGTWFGGGKLKDALKDENIRVTLTVKYVSHEKSEEGYELMERIALAGRHFDEDACVIKLSGGGKVKGSELKVSTPISVRFTSDDLVVEADLWADMFAWLQSSVRGGLIPAK